MENGLGMGKIGTALLPTGASAVVVTYTQPQNDHNSEENQPRAAAAVAAQKRRTTNPQKEPPTIEQNATIAKVPLAPLSGATREAKPVVVRIIEAAVSSIAVPDVIWENLAKRLEVAALPDPAQPAAMEVGEGLIQQATTETANPATLVIREDATGTEEAIEGPRGFGFPSSWPCAAVNLGTRNGTELNV